MSNTYPVKFMMRMDITPTAEKQVSLEQFRHLLFHLQMELGSIEEVFEHLKKESEEAKFEDLKKIDPQLIPQLLARENVLEARRTSCRETARKLLQTALQLDSHCAEAFFEMAGISETAEAAMMWYQKSMDAAVYSLGQERMERLVEEFRIKPWGQIETHYYFKAKVSLAERLYRSGYYEVAILHFGEILALNSTDELELRHYLLAAYLAENRLEDARTLCARYPDDYSAKWYFLKAMLRFKEEGDTPRSRRTLGWAFQRNLWVPVFLLGLEELPPSNLLKKRKGKSFRVGSRREAAECVKCIGTVFCEDSKLIWWIWDLLKTAAAGQVAE